MILFSVTELTELCRFRFIVQLQGGTEPERVQLRMVKTETESVTELGFQHPGKTTPMAPCVAFKAFL